MPVSVNGIVGAALAAEIDPGNDARIFQAIRRDACVDDCDSTGIPDLGRRQTSHLCHAPESRASRRGASSFLSIATSAIEQTSVAPRSHVALPQSTAFAVRSST